MARTLHPTISPNTPPPVAVPSNDRRRSSNNGGRFTRLLHKLAGGSRHVSAPNPSNHGVMERDDCPPPPLPSPKPATATAAAATLSTPTPSRPLPSIYSRLAAIRSDTNLVRSAPLSSPPSTAVPLPPATTNLASMDRTSHQHTATQGSAISWATSLQTSHVFYSASENDAPAGDYRGVYQASGSSCHTHNPSLSTTSTTTRPPPPSMPPPPPPSENAFRPLSQQAGSTTPTQQASPAKVPATPSGLSSAPANLLSLPTVESQPSIRRTRHRSNSLSACLPLSWGPADFDAVSNWLATETSSSPPRTPLPATPLPSTPQGGKCSPASAALLNSLGAALMARSTSDLPNSTYLAPPHDENSTSTWDEGSLSDGPYARLNDAFGNTDSHPRTPEALHLSSPIQRGDSPTVPLNRFSTMGIEACVASWLASPREHTVWPTSLASVSKQEKRQSVLSWVSSAGTEHGYLVPTSSDQNSSTRSMADAQPPRIEVPIALDSLPLASALTPSDAPQEQCTAVGQASPPIMAPAMTTTTSGSTMTRPATEQESVAPSTPPTTVSDTNLSVPTPGPNKPLPPLVEGGSTATVGLGLGLSIPSSSRSPSSGSAAGEQEEEDGDQTVKILPAVDDEEKRDTHGLSPMVRSDIGQDGSPLLKFTSRLSFGLHWHDAWIQSQLQSQSQLDQSVLGSLPTALTPTTDDQQPQKRTKLAPLTPTAQSMGKKASASPRSPHLPPEKYDIPSTPTASELENRLPSAAPSAWTSNWPAAPDTSLGLELGARSVNGEQPVRRSSRRSSSRHLTPVLLHGTEVGSSSVVDAAGSVPPEPQPVVAASPKPQSPQPTATTSLSPERSMMSPRDSLTPTLVSPQTPTSTRSLTPTDVGGLNVRSPSLSPSPASQAKLSPRTPSPSPHGPARTAPVPSLQPSPKPSEPSTPTPPTPITPASAVRRGLRTPVVMVTPPVKETLSPVPGPPPMVPSQRSTSPWSQASPSSHPGHLSSSPSPSPSPTPSTTSTAQGAASPASTIKGSPTSPRVSEETDGMVSDRVLDEPTVGLGLHLGPNMGTTEDDLGAFPVPPGVNAALSTVTWADASAAHRSTPHSPPTTASAPQTSTALSSTPQDPLQAPLDSDTETESEEEEDEGVAVLDQSLWSDRRHYSVIMEESPEEVAAALAEDEWDQVEADEAWAVRLDSPQLPCQPHAHVPHVSHIARQRTVSPHISDPTIISVDTSDSISEDLAPPPWKEWVPSNTTLKPYGGTAARDHHPLLPSRIPTPHFPTLPSLAVLPPAVEDNPFLPLPPHPSSTATKSPALFGSPCLPHSPQPEPMCSTPLASAAPTFAKPGGADLSPSCFAGPDGLWTAI